MKTQQEVWKALEAGHVLVDKRDGQEVHLVDGNVIGVLDPFKTTSPFMFPENWHIKPRKLPFAEALRALVGHECSKIVNRSKTISVHNIVDALMPSDFDREWELIK